MKLDQLTGLANSEVEICGGLYRVSLTRLGAEGTK